MCLQCHEKTAYTESNTSIQDILKDPQFKEWNQTSIAHLFYYVAGYNGPLAHKPALEVMDNYIEWKKDNSKKDDDTFFGQPSVSYVQRARDIGVELYTEYESRNLTMEQAQKEMIEFFGKCEGDPFADNSNSNNEKEMKEDKPYTLSEIEKSYDGICTIL